MPKYRVIRLIEIEYPSFEHYQRDSQNWALPANGARKFGPTSAVYRTATTLVEEMPDVEHTG